MHASHIAGMMASLGARALGPAQSPAACARVPGCGVLVRGGRCRDAREGVAGAPRLLRSRKTSRAELVAFRVFRRESLICSARRGEKILLSERRKKHEGDTGPEARTVNRTDTCTYGRHKVGLGLGPCPLAVGVGRRTRPWATGRSRSGPAARRAAAAPIEAEPQVATPRSKPRKPRGRARRGDEDFATPSRERRDHSLRGDCPLTCCLCGVSALHRLRATLFYDVDTDDDSASSATARTCRPCAPSRCAGSGWCRR